MFLINMSKKALRESIEHWERLVEACEVEDKAKLREEGWGWNNCALCGEYYDSNCFGCPVMEHTALVGCEGTPYEEACFLFNSMTKTGWTSPPWEDLVAAAQEELNFLKSMSGRDSL